MSLYLEHITQRFGQTLALNDIDLEIRNGEFLAILGPSGCGKTTLLRAIGGFAKPTEGKIRMDDVIYSGNGKMVPVEQRDLGMVFQSFASNEESKAETPDRGTEKRSRRCSH